MRLLIPCHLQLVFVNKQQCIAVDQWEYIIKSWHVHELGRTEETKEERNMNKPTSHTF